LSFFGGGTGERERGEDRGEGKERGLGCILLLCKEVLFCLFVCFGCSVFADLLLISAATDLSYEDSILWPFAGTCQGKKQQFCEGLKSCFNS
jgi:hypothetical protein